MALRHFRCFKSLNLRQTSEVADTIVFNSCGLFFSYNSCGLFWIYKSKFFKTINSYDLKGDSVGQVNLVISGVGIVNFISYSYLSRDLIFKKLLIQIIWSNCQFRKQLHQCIRNFEPLLYSYHYLVDREWLEIQKMIMLI